MANMDRTQIANLVRNAQAGDSAAMEQLLQAAYKNVLFQCRRILKHPEDAEDLTQEVLLVVYEKLGTLQEPEHFISWANAIATHRCLNARARNPKDLQFTEDEEGHSVLDTLEESDRQAIPDAALDNAETQRMVRELVDALPELQRVTVLAYYNAEMSIKEIAQEMGVSENTVKSRLVYGRRAIEKGVKDYEKQGIKLYTLSPLPFLLYFLRSAAEVGTGDAAASAAAAAVLSAGGAAAGTAVSGTAGAAAGAAASGSAASGTAGGTAGAAASGTAASGTAGGTAGAAASGTAASGTAGAAAGGTAASAAASGAGILGGLGVKVAALVLAGAVAVGGAAVGIPALIGGGSQTPAPYTVRRTTLAEATEGSLGVWLETPEFEETGKGYEQINAYFDEMHQQFNPEDNRRVRWALERQGDESNGFLATGQVSYQDSGYLSVTFSETVDGSFLSSSGLPTALTFDTQTGELLTLTDLWSAAEDSDGTEEGAAAWIADLICSQGYEYLLTEYNAPSGNDSFRLARYDMESLGYTQGQPLYLWQQDAGHILTIPLPAELLPKAVTGEDLQPVEFPPLVTRRTNAETDIPFVTDYYIETPAFESEEPGYQAINAFFDKQQKAFPGSNVLVEQSEDIPSTEEYPYYNYQRFWVMGRDSRYFSVQQIDSYYLGGQNFGSSFYTTFDVQTGQEVTLEELTGLTEQAITDQVVSWIQNSSEYHSVLDYQPFVYDSQEFYWADGQVFYIWRAQASPRSFDVAIPLTLPAQDQTVDEP